MSESIIKKLVDVEYAEFTTVFANAYPALKVFSEEARQNYQQRLKEAEGDQSINYYSLSRDERVVGGMRLFDFNMKLLSTKIPAGGVGAVAVALDHKKEHVAKDLITFFLQHYRERGALMALLYPFRPDFYKEMGFGYGTKINEFRVKPANLPKDGAKENVSFLTKADLPAFVDCYHHYLEQTNGLLEKKAYELKATFENPENKIVGYRAPGEDKISGYLVFSFKSANPDNFVFNNIVVRQLIYESSEALKGLLKFLQTQADQINEIVIYSQDENLNFLFYDPRNGTNNLMPSVYHESNVQGLGVMYRVLNVPGIFMALAGHNFNDQTCIIKLTIEDDFFPENGGSTILHFKVGKVTVGTGDDSYDFELKLPIAEFSSLLTGAINFKVLYRYGLASLSDTAYLEILDKLFQAEKPLCTTPF